MQECLYHMPIRVRKREYGTREPNDDPGYGSDDEYPLVWVLRWKLGYECLQVGICLEIGLGLKRMWGLVSARGKGVLSGSMEGQTWLVAIVLGDFEMKEDARHVANLSLE